MTTQPQTLIINAAEQQLLMDALNTLDTELGNLCEGGDITSDELVSARAMLEALSTRIEELRV